MMLAERMDLLTKRPRGTLFPPAQNRAAWDTLPADDRMDMETFIAKWRGTPYPLLLLSDYAAFVRTGSRAQCETPYFARRRKLIAAVLDVCLHGESADLSPVEDGLWCICEETTWAISAHANLTAAHPFPISGEPILDLFAAQTAMVLSFTLTLLGDWLDSSLRQRVTAEIQRRAIDPFLHRDTDWWMGFTRKDLCNWTPWIVSNVMFSARCLLDDPLPVYRRACGMLDAYLRCIPADGGCDEGAAYWNMAAGSLLDCLELMAEAGLNCWDEPKLRNMLRFPLLMSLGNGYFANFADCDARPVMYGERLQHAGELLRDVPLTAMAEPARAADGLHRRRAALFAPFAAAFSSGWRRSAGRGHAGHAAAGLAGAHHPPEWVDDVHQGRTQRRKPQSQRRRIADGVCGWASAAGGCGQHGLYRENFLRCALHALELPEYVPQCAIDWRIRAVRRGGVRRAELSHPAGRRVAGHCGGGGRAVGDSRRMGHDGRGSNCGRNRPASAGSRHVHHAGAGEAGNPSGRD